MGEGECAWCVMIYEYRYDHAESSAALTRRYRSYLTQLSPQLYPFYRITLLRRRSMAADLPPNQIWTSSVSSLCYVCVDHISLSLSLSLSLFTQATILHTCITSHISKQGRPNKPSSALAEAQMDTTRSICTTNMRMVVPNSSW